MPNTFTLIASSTVGAGGAASIDFTSIAGTWTDLCIMVSCRSTVADTVDSTGIKINGSIANFTRRYLLGNGSAASSGSVSNNALGIMNAATGTSNTFSNETFYIPNYAGSNNKSISNDSVAENNTTAAYDLLGAGLWSQTSAITSISVYSTGGNLAQYSTAYLYGVKNA